MGDLWHSQTRLNLDAVDRERFTVMGDDVSGHRLVKPVKRADGDAASGGIMTDFREGEQWLRSLEVDAEGNVVSVGFPKFYNHGERPEIDAKAAEWRRDGARAFVREKFDGTLVIATFRDGRWRHRTRGQFNMGSFQPALDEALAGFGIDGAAHSGSYLLELLGPESRQVVDYGPAHSLRLLGYVSHRLGLDVGCFALDLDVAPHCTLEGPGAMAAFAAEVALAGREGGEGFVVDTLHPSGDRILVKVKSDWYRHAHAILSGATQASVWRLLADCGAATREESVAALEAAGFDFEIMTSAGPWVDGYVEQRAGVLGAACDVLRGMPRGDATQKDVAMWAKANAGAFFSVVMDMRAGNIERAERCVMAVILSEKAGALRGVSLGAAGLDALNQAATPDP